MDVLSDVKSMEKVFIVKSDVDQKYDSLNSSIEFVEKSDPLWSWIEAMVLKTRASNHSGLGNIKVHRAFKLNRNYEKNNFIDNVEKIAKECGKQVVPDILKSLVKERIDIDNDLKKYYKEANVLPLFHGTSNFNMIGCVKSGFLLNPLGVKVNGKMFGFGTYYASNASKSISYSSLRGSYWAGGNSDKAYLFIVDVAAGNQKIVCSSGQYTKENIKPYHSVWAKAGQSLYNDEFMVYNETGPKQQHYIRYIVEFGS